MEAVRGQPRVFPRRRAPLIVLGAVAVVLGVVLARALLPSSGGAPTPAPLQGATIPAGSGLPALFVPRHDIGVRMRLQKGQALAIGLGHAPPSPWRAMSAVPFRVISVATGHVWRLRTGRSGRAQLAVPPGRYEVKLGWVHSLRAPWIFNAVRDRAVREGRAMTPSFFKPTPSLQ